MKLPKLFLVFSLVVILVLIVVWLPSFEPATFLTIPLFVLVACVLVEQMISLFLTGRNIWSLRSALRLLGIELGVALFIFEVLPPELVALIRTPLLILICGHVIRTLLRNWFAAAVFQRVIFTTIYFSLIALALHLLLRELEASYAVAFGGGIAGGLLGFAFFTFLSLLYFIPTPAFRALGMWFDRWSSLGFATGFVFSLYIGWIRKILILDEYSHLILGEWIGTSAVFIIVILFVWRGLSRLSEEKKAPEKMAKHINSIDFNKSVDMKHVTNVIQRFIEEGDVGPVVYLLIRECITLQLDDHFILQVVNPLLSYRDSKIPAAIFKWMEKAYEEQNRQRRQKVLMKTIERLTNSFTVKEQKNVCKRA